MVLKGLKCVHNGKIRSNGLEMSQLSTQCKNQVIWSWKESIVYTMVKLGQMVLKRVNWVHNDKNQVIWSWKDSIVYTMVKLGQMVLKGIIWVHNDINRVIWSWKDSIGYTIIKLCPKISSLHKYSVFNKSTVFT